MEFYIYDHKELRMGPSGYFLDNYYCTRIQLKATISLMILLKKLYKLSACLLRFGLHAQFAQMFEDGKQNL
jgi:hypothetical protein